MATATATAAATRSLSPAQVIQRALRLERLRLQPIPEAEADGEGEGEMAANEDGGPKTPVKRAKAAKGERENGLKSRRVVRAVMVDVGGGTVVLRGDGWSVRASAGGGRGRDIF